MLSLDLRVQTALSFFQQSDCIYSIICLVFWAVPRIHNLYRIPFSGDGKSMHKSALLFCETLLQAMEWSKAASVQQKKRALSVSYFGSPDLWLPFLIETIKALLFSSAREGSHHPSHCRHFRSDIRSAASHVHCDHCDFGFAPLGCL